MKQFAVLTGLFSVSILAIWGFFQASQVSSANANDNTPIKVYDATGEMLKAIRAGDNQLAVPVSGLDAAIAPVYDATGAMLEAINPDKKVITVPAYDATGAMLDAITP